MKIRHILLSFVFVLSTCLTALADRTLSRSEVLQLFGQLTSQPKHTWIPAGTIEATHSEYKAPKVTDVNQIAAAITQKIAEYQNNTQKIELTDELQTLAAGAIPFNVRYELANECTMDSDVIVKYDGSRFYWEINVTGRNDSVRPDTTLKTNFMTNHFNLSGNARRMFVWDGAKYTKYFLPANQASVDTTGNVPHIVNGPLTAGVIPWGYGPYSLDNLTAATATAIETVSDTNQPQIYITLTRSNGTETTMLLDPAKNYTVTSCVKTVNNSIIMQQYSGYQQVGSNWVPSNISVEKYDAAASKLLSRDQWTITSISGETPAADEFKIDFKPAAMIEYTNLNKPAICRQMQKTDTGNCATTVIKYAASRLGKEVSDKQLTSLVSGQNNTTDMLAMKNFVKNMGLYASAVNADMHTLKGLKNCQVILHDPVKNHFVMLNELKNDATAYDLITNKEYWRPDFSKCTALVVSNQPVKGTGTVIADAQLGTIVGAGYSCTKIIQQENTVYCVMQAPGACDSTYSYFYQRYGCALAVSGTCSTSNMPRYDSTPCIYDAFYDGCTVTGEWTSYYIRACM